MFCLEKIMTSMTPRWFRIIFLCLTLALLMIVIPVSAQDDMDAAKSLANYMPAETIMYGYLRTDDTLIRDIDSVIGQINQKVTNSPLGAMTGGIPVTLSGLLDTFALQQMGEDYPEIDIDDDSEGLFNTIECNDEIPFQTPEQVEAYANGLSAQIGFAAVSGSLAMFDTCDIWQVPTAPASENAAIVSDVPTLVLNGALDPITPPVWGATAAASLSNSFVYTFPGVGHGAIDGGPCPLGIGLAFLDNPTVAPDSSCIADMELTFFIP
jgi:hypothetical protein